MLRFIKANLTSIDGIEIYPIISLLIFVLFFTAVIIWAFRVDKDKIKTLEELPLTDDNHIK